MRRRQPHRLHVLSVRLTREECAILAAAAAREEMTVSEYTREILVRDARTRVGAPGPDEGAR